jgi:hypothetical protein
MIDAANPDEANILAAEKVPKERPYAAFVGVGERRQGFAITKWSRSQASEAPSDLTITVTYLAAADLELLKSRPPARRRDPAHGRAARSRSQPFTSVGATASTRPEDRLLCGQRCVGAGAPILHRNCASHCGDCSLINDQGLLISSPHSRVTISWITPARANH